MARFFPELTTALQQFITKQHMFFVATAAENGRVNLSPKGLDSFKILGPSQVAWLNLTGSGNETAAHLQQVNRMTIMFCSFTEQPLILRLYGTGTTIHPSDKEWEAYYQHFEDMPGARQIFIVNIDNVQTSCGFAVPRYNFQEQRTRLLDSATKRGEDGIRQYWQEKNRISIDGFPTGMPSEDDHKTLRPK